MRALADNLQTLILAAAVVVMAALSAMGFIRIIEQGGILALAGYAMVLPLTAILGIAAAGLAMSTVAVVCLLILGIFSAQTRDDYPPAQVIGEFIANLRATLAFLRGAALWFASPVWRAAIRWGIAARRRIDREA